jgi:ATP-dependent helicase/nuclease subunit A
VDGAVPETGVAAKAGKGREARRQAGQAGEKGEDPMSTFTESQQLAIAARGNVLVSAGAGTGKTRTVVERCLRLITGEGCSLENILMVTFTDAAAAEMRARLRKEMEKLAAPDSALRIPHSALQEQLALLDTAHISTLHSFCLHLVREGFHLLELDPQVNVLDEAQTVPLQHETLDALLDGCYRRSVPWADDVLAMIRRAGSDDRVRKLVLRLHHHTQSRPDAAAWFERQIGRLNEAEPREWREWLIQEFNELREEHSERLQEYIECDNVGACVAALEACPPTPSFGEVAQALGEIHRARHEMEWKRGTVGKVRDHLEDFFADADFLQSLTQHHNGIDPLQQDWDWMRGPMRALLELARAFTREFTRAKRAQGGVDFSDLEQLALRLLVDADGQPTEVARAWQRRFTHVFVDECQDINAAQDAIIRAIAQCGTQNADSPQSDAVPHSAFRIPHSGNRFLVGDVKQSIYRFRQAAPAIFRDYERQWRDGPHGARIPLSDNFRSREGILDFVNSVFAELMRESLGGVHYDEDARLRFGAPDQRAPLSNAKGGGPRVELQVIHKVKQPADDADGDDAGNERDDENSDRRPVEDLLSVEKEARLVAERLIALRKSLHEIWDEDAKAMRPVEWRDMVVLVRSPASRVEAFAKEFSKAGVPLAAARAGFYQAVEVQDLINLLRLLDNPLQDIPLAAVLRSPLVGMSVDELAAVRIAGGEGRRIPFFAAVNRLVHQAVGAPEGWSENVGQTSCLPVRAASCRPNSGAGMPRESSGWKPDLHLQTGSELQQAGTAKAKLDSFHRRLTRWRLLIRQTSLSHCLETVLGETGHEALLLAGERGRERVANVRRLLELARQFDPFQRQGLHRFLRFIDEQEDAELDQESASVETENAVRLMSIHKSKGLEFPVVVVACLGAGFNFPDLKEDILLDPELGLCAKVMPPHGDQRYPSLAWRMARRREKRELLGEELRLLYVAMTRARDTLVLTGFDKSKVAEERWGGGVAITDREIAKENSFLAWMRLWLNAHTQVGDWTSETAGGTALLKWWRFAETEERFRMSNDECRMTNGMNAGDAVTPREKDEAARGDLISTGLQPGESGSHEGTAASAASAGFEKPLKRLPVTRAPDTGLKPGANETGDSANEMPEPEPHALLDLIRLRLAWRYEHDAATRETAKSNVTALRRRAAQEDEEERPLFRFRTRTPREGKMSAAEIGSAHHVFLQHVEFARTATLLDLKNEAERMVCEGTLTRDEVARLDFRALLAFWESAVGCAVREAGPCMVHRELPFTARFTTAELRGLGLCEEEFATEEFVIVQGVIDLAVIRPAGIVVVDFKTDHLDEEEIEARAREYRPQLQLYGAALNRIHGRPVAGLHLHFLSCGQTIPVESPAKILSTNRC